MDPLWARFVTRKLAGNFIAGEVTRTQNGKIFHLVVKRNYRGLQPNSVSCSMLRDYFKEVSFREYAYERSVFDNGHGSYVFLPHNLCSLTHVGFRFYG
jgi:hypothetical protein